MSIATLDLAQSMGLSEPELMERALAAFLHEQRRELLQLRLEFLSRYDVATIAELEARVANGDVPEHPAWEDLIVVENLDARLEEVDGYLRDL